MQHTYTQTHFTIFTQPKKKSLLTNLDCKTCFLIREFGIKRTFRGKIGRKYRAQSWDQNKGVHN